MRVLLTGFEPNDDGLNSSEIIINSLQNNPPQELKKCINNIAFQIMPGDTNILEQVVDETLRTYSPKICILTGQARGYSKIALERMAKNLRHFATLDRAGNAPKGEKIVADSPVAYWSTLSGQESLVSLLKIHNIPARISNDCGTHLCNQIFYHFLHWGKLHNSNMKVGFIHIPVLPEQVIKSQFELPFMPIDMSRKALSLILGRLL
jgi:pyroglutamyl-peptidase